MEGGGKEGEGGEEGEDEETAWVRIHLTAAAHCATFYGKAHRVFLTHLLSTDSIFLSTCIDIILTPTLCTIYACHAPLYTFANKYMIRAACLRKLLTDQSETFCRRVPGFFRAAPSFSLFLVLCGLQMHRFRVQNQL